LTQEQLFSYIFASLKSNKWLSERKVTSNLAENRKPKDIP